MLAVIELALSKKIAAEQCERWEGLAAPGMYLATLMSLHLRQLAPPATCTAHVPPQVGNHTPSSKCRPTHRCQALGSDRILAAMHMPS